MIKMTLREALKIQSEQVAWYGQRHGAKKVAAMVANKTADLSSYDLDAPMDVADINALVPRGASIEYMIGISQNNID